jgi:hypothetical protein
MSQIRMVPRDYHRLAFKYPSLHARGRHVKCGWLGEVGWESLADLFQSSLLKNCE